MKIRHNFVAMLTLIASGGLVAAPVHAADREWSGTQIRKLGLEARLDGVNRDAILRQLSEGMETLPKARVHELQGDFQYALLLQCDPEIYATLAPETIEGVDAALEGLFDFEDIDRDTHWEPLIYAYGFFNRDVDPEAIEKVLSRWASLSDKEKAPRYPTYIHVIDAVCKPLSMGSVGDKQRTREAMMLVLPALKSLFTAKPKPGTAFHGPSHACLILGPLYDRWSEDPNLGPLVVEHLGDREAFEALLQSQLAGAQEKPDSLSALERRYYFYVGSYLANTLARQNVRSAVPALRKSLALYEGNGGNKRVKSYTQRALVALGDDEARAQFEKSLADSQSNGQAVKTLVWLCRNGQDETREYGQLLLGKYLKCPPDDSLEAYFQQQLDL